MYFCWKPTSLLPYTWFDIFLARNLSLAVVCSMRGGRPMDITPRNHVYHAGFLVSTGRESIRSLWKKQYNLFQGFTMTQQVADVKILSTRVPEETSIISCQRMNVKCTVKDVSPFRNKKNHIFWVQCERGSPLRVGENAQRCQTNAQCPSSHECKADHGVCCPRKREYSLVSLTIISRDNLCPATAGGWLYRECETLLVQR